jgi:hypothetical protein
MRDCIAALVIVGSFLVTGPAAAERSDQVVLWNGDTISGEVKSLQQGQLRLKTDHAGTVFIEWEHIHAVTSDSFFEVEDNLGDFYYGVLSTGQGERELIVVGPTRTVLLDMASVVKIMPIERNFWGRIDGSLNLGFSFTSADNILQYSFESNATYRVQKYSAAVTLSSIETQQEQRDRTFRDQLGFNFTRNLKNRYFTAGTLDFSRSSELGVDLRTQLGWMFGRNFVQSNRSRVAGAAGLTVSRDVPAGDEPDETYLSALLGGSYRFFLYNYPKTEISVDLSFLPGITDWPRWRGEFSAVLKREIIHDFTVNFSVFDSYDSDPPGGEESANHDFGVVLSVGWTF